MEQTTFPVGTLLAITTGDHGDYMVLGVFRTLKDLDMPAYREAYLAQNPEQRNRTIFTDAQLVAALTRDGFIEVVSCAELHISANWRGELRLDTSASIEEHS